MVFHTRPHLTWKDYSASEEPRQFLQEFLSERQLKKSGMDIGLDGNFVPVRSQEPEARISTDLPSGLILLGRDQQGGYSRKLAARLPSTIERFWLLASDRDREGCNFSGLRLLFQFYYRPHACGRRRNPQPLMIQGQRSQLNQRQDQTSYQGPKESNHSQDDQEGCPGP